MQNVQRPNDPGQRPNPAAPHTPGHAAPVLRGGHDASLSHGPAIADRNASNLVDPCAAGASLHDSGRLEDPLELVEDSAETKAAVDSARKRIITFDTENIHRKENFKRNTHSTGTGACRVRSFHGKYSDEGLRFMDNCINDWLDSHPDIDIKFVTSTVNTFVGKNAEPQLVLNVWY